MEVMVIQNKVYTLRGCKVMLDFDLAELYEIETRTLKQAVRRNIERFPEDFMFELTAEESASLRSQIVILEKGKGRHSKYLPFAFTEQGVAMLSSVCCDRSRELSARKDWVGKYVPGSHLAALPSSPDPKAVS